MDSVEKPTFKVFDKNQKHSISNESSYSGASRSSAEIALWIPPVQSADASLLYEKDTLDARANDLLRNNAYVSGVVSSRKDSIVGGSYRLNARPKYKLFKRKEMDATWLDEFRHYVELKFNLAAESENCWFDVAGKMTFADMIRLDIAVGTITGETVATVEWLRDITRPFRTAIYSIDPARLENPSGASIEQGWRKGVFQDRFGKPLRYSFRQQLPNDIFDMRDLNQYKVVNARKPWGRKQVIHIFEPDRVAQSRGVTELAAALKQIRMLGRYQDVVLQNAVLNASYAAALESDLPYQDAAETLGAGQFNSEGVAQYLQSINSYQSTGKNLQIDRVKVPVLHPGTRLKVMNPGQPGGVGTGFEESLLRHIATNFNMSYEEFSHDFTKTNYSSARAAMGETEKATRARKKVFADRKANAIYRLWFEEDLNSGNMRDVLPRNPPSFYEGLNADAYVAATWIGAPKGQIDELKETRAAIERIENNISTLEKECARFGEDYRDILEQRLRERQIEKDFGDQLGEPFNATRTVVLPVEESSEDDNDSEDEKDA